MGNNAEVVDDVERGGSPNLRKSRSGLQGHGENAPLNTREKGLGRDPSPTRYSTFNKAEIGDDVERGGSPNLRKSRSGLRGPGENPSPNTREKGPGRDPSPTRDSTFNKAEIGDDVERGRSPIFRKSRSGLRGPGENASPRTREKRPGRDPSPTRHSPTGSAHQHGRG